MTRFLCPCGPEKPNHDGFLRPRRERPCDCGAGNTFDEVAPPHCLPPRLRTNHRTAVTHSLEGVSGGSGCPLWVKSRHMRCTSSCPLYLTKRTCSVQPAISTFGQ